MRKVLSPLVFLVSLVFIGMVSFLGVAHAAAAVEPDGGSLLDLAKPIYDQLLAGHFIACGALALVLVVGLMKRYAPVGKIQDFLHSDAGGALTTFLVALGGAVATATISGATWHWSMLGAAGTIAFAAAGSFALIKKLIVTPLLASVWYQTKAPVWFKDVLGMALWLFSKPDTVATAEAAGTAAVVAAPAGGTVAVTGVPTDIK